MGSRCQFFGAVAWGKTVMRQSLIRNVMVKIGLVALLAAFIVPVSTITATKAAWAAPATYSYTGAPQLYVVPAGVSSITVTVSGAEGNAPGGSTAGRGATVSATIAVTPGESLQINVGGSGSHGGWNGGGTGVTSAGGATDIRRPAFSTSSSCAFNLNCGYSQRIVVAGGGGSGASFGAYTANGGDAALVGNAGSFTNWSTGALTAGGGGGTASAGGTSQAGAAGALGVGGTSGYGAGGIVGGNGGGGYYGGGSGGQTVDVSSFPNAFAGGGGGSSYVGGVGVSAGAVTGFNTGDGSLTVSVASAITDATMIYTGTPQFYTVPATIAEMYVKIFGAAGNEIQGDTVTGRLPVTPGQVLQVNLGGRGWGSTADTGFTPYAGGWNGGGSGLPGGGGSSSSGGGGASDIRMCSAPQSSLCALTDRVVVAGGGGGSWEAQWGFSGGVGGKAVNGSGDNASNPQGATFAPEGGTLLSGGRGAIGGGGSNAWVPALDGSLGQGGSSSTYGGGGGGGYFGGGAGNIFGGGGGSSFASITGPTGSSVLGPIGSAFQHSRGGASGDGSLIIVAMPQATSTSATVSGYTSANIMGSVNPRYLASTPTVYYGTVQSSVEAHSSFSAAITGPNSASTLAGSTVQEVSGGLTGLTAASTYYYQVCAQSVAGLSCGTTLNFSTPAIGSPIWVDQDASGSTAQNSVFTNYIFQASGSGTMSYSVTSGALPTGLSLDPNTGVLSGTPTAGGTFTFNVTANNGFGQPVNSVLNTITVSGAAPSAPTNTLAVPGGNQVTVSWTAPTSNGGSPITGYTVTASNGASCTATPPSTSCVVVGLAPGMQLSFTVTATNLIGTSVNSVASSSVTVGSQLPNTGVQIARNFSFAVFSLLLGGLVSIWAQSRRMRFTRK